jgi:Spy/CpxP family protein refolding chaperone
MIRKCLSLIVLAGALLADQPLKSALGLSMDQAKAVYDIEMKHQKPFAAKRQERNAERRKMVRTKLANDSKLMAEQERIVDRLTAELRQIQMTEDAEIRRLLTPEQSKKFDDYLKLRREMKGSSRDDKP